MRVERVRVGPIEIEYEDHGEGDRPFLLVHGFTGSRDDFREVLPPLARRGRTLALDLRGHGGTTNPGDPAAYGLGILKDDVVGFLDALGIERCDLLGHSMGGMVALRLVLEHPERVASLVLMDTSPGPVHPKARGWFETAGRIAREQGMKVLFGLSRQVAGRDPNRPPAAEKPIRRMGEEPWWERIRAKLEAMDPVAFSELGVMLAGHEGVEPRLGEIACPTTIVVGDQDAPFRKPSEVMEAGIPGAKLFVIEDAAHSPQFESPEEWLRIIEGHLDGARAPEGSS